MHSSALAIPDKVIFITWYAPLVMWAFVSLLGQETAMPHFWQIPMLTCSPLVGWRSLMSPMSTRESIPALYRTVTCPSMQS